MLTKVASRFKTSFGGLQDTDRIFTNIYGDHNVSLSTAEARGDWNRTKDIIAKGQEWIIQEIKNSGLRGRGGAGFPTGLKLSFMPKPVEGRPHYLCINADESEPGTCKDREILRHEPHKVIEGTLISAFAIGANKAYIFIRGEYWSEYLILQNAVEEAYKKGKLGPNACGSGFAMDIVVHRSAGSYVCGEETGLLESLEGKQGRPRNKPPFPSQKGLYGCPTTIMNTETVAAIPEILRRGASWYSSFGRKNNHGTKLFCLSGSINNPTVVEEEMSIPLKELIERHGKGVQGGWDKVQAIIPGGSSVSMLKKEQAEEVLMDYDSLKQAGSSLGTGAVMVFSTDIDLIASMLRFAQFYKNESCGQCTPCREGTEWLVQRLLQIQEGSIWPEEIDQLYEFTQSIEGKTICGLGDCAAIPVKSFYNQFKNLMMDRHLAYKAKHPEEFKQPESLGLEDFM